MGLSAGSYTREFVNTFRVDGVASLERVINEPKNDFSPNDSMPVAVVVVSQLCSVMARSRPRPMDWKRTVVLSNRTGVLNSNFIDE